ncbi:7TM-DISM domain-containing protein [Pseudomonas sp.]|uniref:hybrid sensor histidine kinase/response regulator n=1 Tax=Pseudomonas sp. TaxID=306 RepID=UPI0028B0FA5A|nr:7TM-DISM domain-containing protein [Pseudomonas sp.]
MRRLLVGVLALLGVTCAEPVLAALPLCQEAAVGLLPRLGIHEDPSGRAGIEDIQRLADGEFRPAGPDWPPKSYTNSAIWMRLTLANPAAESCSRWLSVGAPRLEDIQVYVRRQGAWQRFVAGSAYPLEQWPVVQRQPLFPLSLEAGEHAEVLIRVGGGSPLLLSPMLWPDLPLLQDRQAIYLEDGLTLGIVLLLAPFSVIVGWMLRSRLLILHAGAVFSYVGLASLIGGYLVYWPEALPWFRPLLVLVACLAHLAFLTYIYELLQVRRLPWFWNGAFGLLLCGYCAGRLYWLGVEPVLGSRIAETCLCLCLYVLLPAALLAGWRRGIRHSWLAWLVPSAYLLQFVVRYVLELDQVPWQAVEYRYSLSSALPGVLLLVGTLVMEVGGGRNRERQAQRALEASQGQLEQTVTLRTAQLREALNARGSLLARISHDLRAPLASIIDYARLSRQAPRGNDYSLNIERNARYQMGLIDELLEFSQGQLQQMELIEAPGYLHSFLNELVEEGRFLAARQGNRLEYLPAEQLPALVQADFQRLRQVLMNLLGNAAKFTRDGLIRFEVSNEAEATDGRVRLQFSVTDNGIGIDPAERETLLQPFSRGHDVGQYEGSGLGLSIVAQLLDAMGSELRIERAEPRGSRFIFALDLQLAGEDDLDAAFGESFVGAVDGGGRRVLVVDDVAMNREWLCDLLEGYGYQTQSAADGEGALECLRQQPFDLVLCDQSMPRMDGWALLRTLRAGWPRLPALLYSAAPARRPVDFPEWLDFDASLLKPSDTAELLRTIDGLTGRALHAAVS